ncbi:glycosyltransferase [Afipia sp. DC4300-2b1]|uniref:glycosyltransferase n=1 Tax=Afipia sp. DC4300-2b1 TaxID=2804672 RepID=UPI003CF322B2
MVKLMVIQSKHVAVYVPALNRGGAERVAALLASGFFKAGWRTSLLVDFEASENRALIDAGVSICVLGSSHARSILTLTGFLRSQKPDVVLAIGGAANVKLSVARLLAGGQSRIVLSYHGRSDVGRGRLGHLSYSFAPWLARRADAVVCVSDGLLEHLRDDWKATPDKLTRIYNPVSVEHAIRASHSDILQRPPVVLGVGRLNPEKNFAALVQALPHLPPDARVVIFGEGPERDNLLVLAKQLGVADRLELPGYRDDPWPCYAQGRCFALTSRREAFGNVVVEALASGLPVVSTRSGGPDEILQHGRVGSLVDHGDIDALARAINQALADPGDPAPRIARARMFDAETAIGSYLGLFNTILIRR